MNDLVPNYLFPYVLTGTLATVAAVMFGIHKALKLAGWPSRDRRQAVWKLAVLLGTWFVAALVPSWLGLYRTASSGAPTVVYGLLIPIIVGVLLFRQWPTLRRVIEAVPQRWIVTVQLYRAEGLIFLVLYASGHLPGVFAWPAGVGDILLGLLAPVIGAAYAHESRNAAGWLRTWNLFGIADLIVAVATGFLSSPSPLQMFAFGAPNELISAFPLAMIPVFLVPLSVLLHLASLKKLQQTQTGWQLHEPLLVGQRS
ncbi:MAG: hypothetical protein WB992_20370 [Bryobacteraceae bacterium]